jgi:hypothetical protein
MGTLVEVVSKIKMKRSASNERKWCAFVQVWWSLIVVDCVFGVAMQLIDERNHPQEPTRVQYPWTSTKAS